MNLVVGLLSLALLAGILKTRKVARGHRLRWGRTVETRPSVGQGAYRSAPIRIERPRSIPAVCWFASVTAFAWGALTVFVFAPAGTVLFGGSACCASELAHHGWLFGLGTVGLFVAVVRGFIVGPRLMRAVDVLAARRTCSAESVASVARQSLFHHTLVAAALGATCFGAGGEPIMFAVSAIPCALGLAQAALLFAAQATLAGLDREDAAALDLE